MSGLKRNDRHDTDRTELELIRVGHALWAILKRGRARNEGYLPQSDPICEALATVWRIKREHRAHPVAKRTVENARLRAKFAKVQVET